MINKEQVFGFVREVLMFVMAVLISKDILPSTIADQIIEFVVMLGITIWGAVEKTQKGFSPWISVIRKGLGMTGGFLVGYNVLDNTMWSTISGAVLSVLSMVSSLITHARKDK